ncbi:probable leucine-rich repeat receptor-like protein kinase At5g49770 [Gastrolobium bilobum]|uniref:probable leucine-rich repeat receptor-like protein kinase At5g49770 n=1 Tax=Gastrolobium bilobum TaxID=150636 RepID=UPI002AAF29C1|nr:probable leucine-rich repeat receptor-like protein kinase At5g49770 [Gastrolobium bilobum]
MNPIGLSLLFLLSLALVSIVIGQERAPHGLVYENPEAFPPSAYNFFHPNVRKPETTKDPCTISKCSPFPLAAQVEATQVHHNKASTSERSRKKLGAGGVAGIVFGVAFVVLLAMSVYHTRVIEDDNSEKHRDIKIPWEYFGIWNCISQPGEICVFNKVQKKPAFSPVHFNEDNLFKAFFTHFLNAAEALFTFKDSLDSPQQFRCSIVKYPCQKQWPCLDCYKLKDPGVITAKIDGNNDIPTLTPLQEAQVDKQGGRRDALIVGVVVSALVVIVIVVIVYICLMRVKRFIRQTSESASSMPSPTVEMGSGNNSHYVNAFSPHYCQNTRQLTILELEQATGNFSESNIIGEGRFGFVYKGLLQDGSIVAIKRRLFALTRDFIPEVKQIADIHHIHLVKLIGYYEDSYQQLLVHEYLPNGNVGNHLYDSEGLPIGRLDLWRRLSIALGTSKGLEHLHSLVPPLVHTNFRTSNVLLDENYNAKVSDYGLCKLQTKVDQAGSSSNVDCFLDPEFSLSQNYSEQSDVYSFGVFLLELISGCEAHNRNMSNPEENLVFQAKNSNGLDKFVDITLGDHERHAARRMMKLALLCVDVTFRRPSMAQIVQELERIQREIAPLCCQVNEEIGVVTLGSELFQ